VKKGNYSGANVAFSLEELIKIFLKDDTKCNKKPPSPVIFIEPEKGAPSIDKKSSACFYI